MKIRTQSKAWLALMAAGALTLAGCASASDSGSSSESSDQDTSAESTDSAGAGDSADFPNRPFTLMIPYNPGGSTDPVGREFAAQLAAELGTTAVPQNIPGGNETVGLTYVFNSEPDGYTIGLSSATGIITQPLVNTDLSFQTADDYTPLAKVVQAPNAIFVRQDSPYETFEDLLEAARANPGEIRIGSTGTLTNNTFTILAIEEQAGVDFQIVPFSGGAGEATRAAISGEIEGVIPTVPGQLGFVQSGDIRALAHTGGDAYESILPGSVALNSDGYNVPFSSDYVVVAPKGLDPEVERILRDAAVKVAASDAWAEWCAEKGFLPTPLGDEELLDWINNTTDGIASAISLAENAG